MTIRMRCGDGAIEIGERTLIMGIVNATPDSFSDGGQYDTIDRAVSHAAKLVQDGADMIDIGGESTRPGADKVPVELELERVVPIIKILAKQLEIPVSIDTYKAEVARQALDAGASMINDVWGLLADPLMAEVAAHYRCPIIITHNRLQPGYDSFLEDVIRDLHQQIAMAHAAGIEDAQIILDPGIGFAKNAAENLLLMNHLREIVSMGYPVLLGTSRKSFIRQILQRSADGVLEGTAATVALGIAQGCEIIRVHDVQEMKRVAQMADAIVRGPQSAG